MGIPCEGKTIAIVSEPTLNREAAAEETSQWRTFAKIMNLTLPVLVEVYEDSTCRIAEHGTE